MGTHDTCSSHLKCFATTTPTLGARNVGEIGEESTEQSPTIRRGRVSLHIRGCGQGRRIRERGRGQGTGRERRTEYSYETLITKTTDAMGEWNHHLDVISDRSNGIMDRNGGYYVIDDCEINSQVDDGELGREKGRLFDHEVIADLYNSLMDKLGTVKEGKERLSNCLNLCEQKLNKRKQIP